MTIILDSDIETVALEPTTSTQATVETAAPAEPTFADMELPFFIKNNLASMGFVKPTAIQSPSIEALMAGNDLVARSQTGSGKTAAFGIPLIARTNRRFRRMQALILVPTRELCVQVTTVLKQLAGPEVKITPIYGGVGMQGQIIALTRAGTQIVVGTPGRIRDHMTRGTINFNFVKMLVLDEADEMLNQGFAQDVEAIIGQIPQNRQTALFSATMPEWVAQMAEKHLHAGFTTLSIEATAESAPDITQIVYEVPFVEKMDALRSLLDTHYQEPILVFGRTKHGVEKLADKLSEAGYKVGALQGNMAQNAREAVMRSFRRGDVRILVATNVAARGIDVTGIGHVINYDLPESAELFTHRIGRTGRNGLSGKAVTFLTGEDRAKWREIVRHLGAEAASKIERMRWSNGALHEITPEEEQPRRSGGGYGNRNGGYGNRGGGYGNRGYGDRNNSGGYRPAFRDGYRSDRPAARRDDLRDGGNRPAARQDGDNRFERRDGGREQDNSSRTERFERRVEQSRPAPRGGRRFERDNG